MNFYKRYMGDFRRKTGHLSLTAKGAYDALLDHYYSTGRPLPDSMDALCRIAGASGTLETDSVSEVVSEFFPLSADGFRHNKRADEEISRWNAQAIVNREVGKLGGRPRKTESVTESGTEQKPNHNPKLEVRSTSSRAPKNPGADKRLNGDTEQAKATRRSTWEAYSTAYFNRYGTEPLKDAQANSLIAQFCKRIPGAEAAAIAAFYVAHNKYSYVNSKHDLKLMLASASGLHTDWKTGQQTTESQARKVDQGQSQKAIWDKLATERKAIS